MSDEIGSVMMDGEEELVMPTIPIRPNNSIPVAIGILLILGSLVGALLAFGSGVLVFADNQMMEDAGYTEEQMEYVEMLRDSGMAQIFTVLYSIMTVGLMISGVLLIRKNAFGVKLGTASASIFLFSNIVQSIWEQMIADDYGLEVTIGGGLIMEFACGAFCIALPLVAILIPEGRAALYREPVTLDSIPTYGEEE